MSPRPLRLVTVSALLGGLLAPASARAQAPDRAPLALQLPAATPSVAFGGAFPLAERTSDAVFAHPGVLDRARGAELGVQVWEDGATGASASGAFQWWDGAAAVGVRTLTYRIHAGAAGAGTPTLPTEDGLFDGDGVPVTELVGAVGYGQDVGHVRLGAVGKWIERRVDGRRALTGAADLGLAGELSGVTVGAAAQNLGPALRRGGRDIPLPWDVTAGASFSGAPVGPLDLGAAAELAVRADGEVAPAGGLEVAWWPVLGRTFVGRIGLRRVPEGGGDPLSFGAAFYGDAFGVEYAYRGFQGAASHRIGVRWR